MPGSIRTLAGLSGSRLSVACDMKDIRARYEAELLERIVPFWTEHGIDREHGGFFSVVGRKGELLETDKYLWMQWRAVFMFAAL